jgi:hypothetical protein
MSTLNFGAEQDGNISCTKVETGQKIIIDTYVNLLTETQMRMRLLCDFIKDALVDSKLNMDQCKQIITAIYCSGTIVSEPNVNSLPSPFDQTEINKLLDSDYKNLLAELHDTLDNDPNIKAKTTELINQPKLSTVGSNTKISDAEYVFWESGFGSDLIMRSPNFHNILTPAAIMDPLGKEAPNAYFPMPNLNIVFDKTFTKRLGFPDTMWGCNDIQGPSPQVPIAKQVSIQYTQLSSGLTPEINPEILSAGFIPYINPFINAQIPFTTKPDIKAGPFGPYLKGNKEKNADIRELAKQGFSADAKVANFTAVMQIIKILETKELGDVAQIWLYLAYLIENDLLAQREKALMITTDSVVYLFCQLLNLSCAYTGSRAGLESKNCNIYHYVAGPPDYQAKIANMLTNACDIVSQKIASQKFILVSVKADPTLSNFWYIGETSRSKPADVPGRTGANPDFIIQKFQEFFTDLETKEQGLKEIKKEIFEYLQVNLHIDDSQVVATFDNYHSKILEFECKQYFTKVKGKGKGLSGGYKNMLQNQFRDELYPHLKLKKGGSSSIDKVNYMINETSSSKFISEEKNYVGGIMNRSDINNEVSLLEATILIYSYIKLLIQEDIAILIEEEFDQGEISLLAMTYDNNSYYVDDEKYQEFYTFIIGKELGIYDFPSTTDIVTITLNDENYEEYVLVLGTTLSQYLYFENDLSVVFPEKSVGLAFIEASKRATRSMHVPIFVPSTYCDGQYDAYTRPDGGHVQIPVGTGMYIDRLCYTAHTFVAIIRHIINTVQGISFVNIFKELFQTLLNNSSQKLGTPLYALEAILANSEQQEKFLKDLKNILAFIFTFDKELYDMLIIKIQQDSIQGTIQGKLTQGIPFLGNVILVDNSLIKFAIDNGTKPSFGGSNKYLLKKIKSKKNRVKKVKSKKNRAKKIKSKQHRLKKIKSKKFTRKNKKSKNGVI